MRPIGFSTGALALGDFRAALRMLLDQPVSAVELSALRLHELLPLSAALPALPLSPFGYVSVHAPSVYDQAEEAELSQRLLGLLPLLPAGASVIVHPDAIRRFERWQPFGDRLLIENMDLRKATGRTAAELLPIFARLPQASFCFDLGHARQVDPTMDGARALLRHFAPRLRQLHVSEVDAASRHQPLSPATMAAFRQISPLIPGETPAILEAPVCPASAAELQTELHHVSECLSS
jgi:Lon protease-like protein